MEEIVTRNGNQKVGQSNGLLLKAKVDDVPEKPSTSNNPSNNNNSTNDPTIAKGKLPYTGAIKILFIVSLAAGTVIASFKKYKKLDNDIKGK